MFRRLNQENWRSAKKTLATCLQLQLIEREKSGLLECHQSIELIREARRCQERMSQVLGTFQNLAHWMVMVLSNHVQPCFRKGLELTYIL